MADVICRRGQSANLDNVIVADGQILVTEDIGEMYVVMSNGIRKIAEVDGVYNPKSINPQSGIAVAKAINSTVGDISATLDKKTY